MVRRWWLLSVLVVAGAVSVSQPQEKRFVAEEKALKFGRRAGPEFVGSSSCSARACHGGLEPIGDPLQTAILQDEYPKWLLRDKHTRAYQVLLEEPSLRIAQHLAGGGAVRPPYKDDRCLACHTVPSLGHAQADLQLGVSCEACHGPSSVWLPLHTRPEWRTASAELKRRQGMIPVADIGARTEACASCHVGSPGRDVNHDLIAAGHPRLNFEYASFMANVPPHWNVSAKRQAGDGATDWAVGQIESAKAALRLLEHRAKSKEGPWPEFAEYDCFACHHDLDAQSWRQARKDETRKPGTLPWGTWYFTMPNLLADSPSFHSALVDLRKEMEKPLPRQDVSVKRLQTELDTLQGRLRQLDSMKLKILLATPPADKSWDSAEQLFLAACALPEMQNQKSLADLNRYRVVRVDWSSPKLFHFDFFAAFQKVMKSP